MVFLTSLILFCSLSWSQVDKNSVSEMLDRMVQEKAISKEEAEKAKLRMNSMNDKEWGGLNSAAQDIVKKRSPASSEAPGKIEQYDSKDLSASQLNQIQADMKKIVPEW